jgi:cell division septation protein DedD
VVDLTHDASDDGFHEIQLSGKQLVFLFMATTVVSVVIFLCGVLVGRGVRAQQVLGDLAAPPAAAAPAATDTLADAGPPAAEPPTPPAETSDPPVSVKNRVEAQRPPVETLKPSTQAAEVKPAAPPPATEAPAAAPANPPAAKSASAPPASQPQPSTSRSQRTPQTSPRGRWVVQIVALRDRGAASSIVERLSGKGYPAYVVNPTAGTPAPVFKVQVGRYADRDEAEQVARRLEREEQFKPWVSR